MLIFEAKSDSGIMQPFWDFVVMNQPLTAVRFHVNYFVGRYSGAGDGQTRIDNGEFYFVSSLLTPERQFVNNLEDVKCARFVVLVNVVSFSEHVTDADVATDAQFTNNPFDILVADDRTSNDVRLRHTTDSETTESSTNVNVTFSNTTISDQERMHNVLRVATEAATLLENVNVANVTLLGSTDTTVHHVDVAGSVDELHEISLGDSDETVTETFALEARIIDGTDVFTPAYNGNNTPPDAATRGVSASTESINVAEEHYFEMRMHDSTEVSVNSTEEDSVDEFDLRVHVADSTEMIKTDNSTQAGVTDEFDDAYLWLDGPDLSERNGTANYSTRGEQMLPSTSIDNGDRFGNDEDTVLVVYAELSENQNTTNVELPMNLSLAIAERTGSVNQTETPIVVLAATTKLLDVTPVLSDLERISEDENATAESAPSATLELNTMMATLPSHDAEEQGGLDDFDFSMNSAPTAFNSSHWQVGDDATPEVLFDHPADGTHIASLQNGTGLNMTGRAALVGQGREFFPFDQGVCLAVPYPCGPGKSCTIVK